MTTAEKFPALSIRQPWADYVVLGLKDVENRGKATRFRGTILIHASRTVDADAGISEEEAQALREAGILRAGDEDYFPQTGAIIGMVDIVDCVREHDSRYFEGPVGWVLANPVRFERPIEYAGRLGIFYVPREFLRGTPAESAQPGSGGPIRPEPTSGSIQMEDPGRRRYWVWVAGPDYYLDDQGGERVDLEPDTPIEDDGWWTCHRETRRGDLIMLYRTRPKQDIAYLIEARTSARILKSDRPEHALSMDEWVALVQDAAESDPELGRRFEELGAVAEDHEARMVELETQRETTQAAIQAQRRSARPAPDRNSVNQELARLEAELARTDSELCRLDEEYAVHAATWQELSRPLFRKKGLPEDTQVVDRDEFAGDFVCDYVPRYHFEKPIPLATMKADPLLSKYWGALRGGFRQRVYAIPEECWHRLVELASPGNPGLADAIQAADERDR